MSLVENAKYLSPVWARYTDILVERGEGACLYAADGRSYLDFTCGIGVTNTGHCHHARVAVTASRPGCCCTARPTSSTTSRCWS